MKIVALLSSPRKRGNSELLVEEVLKGIEGATVKKHHLNQLSIKGCQACLGCKEKENCVIKDDATEILEDIKEADAVIFATPVYMWQMTGQLKTLVDRLYSFMNPDFSSKLTPGKKVLWVVTQGNPDESLFMPYFENAGQMLKIVGLGDYQILLAGGLREAGAVKNDQAVLDKAKTMGQWLGSK